MLIPVRVGLVGTGYAAKLRAGALSDDPRAQLVAVAGHSPENVALFSQRYGAEPVVSWRQLVERPDIDLVVISNISRDHDLITRAALLAEKHVVVEYPLSFSPLEAESLIELSQQQGKLLHVEHIELMGGVHQAVVQQLSQLGEVFYGRYITISPQKPAPRRWSYQPELFGFPLVGALSRLHRLIDLFGQVATVRCQNRYWPATEQGFITSCLCIAQLEFVSGIMAEVVYGKGENFSTPDRQFEVYGTAGRLIFTGDIGYLYRGDVRKSVEVGPKQGSFVKDTSAVLDYLLENIPLYVNATASLYTLRVAEAARISAQTGQTIRPTDKI